MAAGPVSWAGCQDRRPMPDAGSSLQCDRAVACNKVNIGQAAACLCDLRHNTAVPEYFF